MQHHTDITLTKKSGTGSSSCAAQTASVPPLHDVILNASEAVDIPVSGLHAALPEDLIQGDEVILLLIRPSPLFILLGAAGGVVFISLITMLLAYLARSLPMWIGWTDAQAFGLGAFLIFLRLGWQALDWWNRLYVLTDRRMIRKMGILRIAVFETPLSRIQHTSVFMRLRERLFGLGTIGFSTAGSSTYEAFWLMISKPYAVHKIVVEAMNRYGRSNPQ